MLKLSIWGEGGDTKSQVDSERFFSYSWWKREGSLPLSSLPFLSGGLLVGREGEQQFSSSFPFLGVEERGFLWGSVSSVTGRERF